MKGEIPVATQPIEISKDESEMPLQTKSTEELREKGKRMKHEEDDFNLK